MKSILSAAIAVFFSFSLMAQTANLKFNLEKGKTYRAKTSSQINSATNYNGMQQSSEVNSTSILSLKPVSVNADHFVAEVRFDTVMTKISMPKMEMSSSNPGNIKSTDPSEVMGCILYRLSQATLNIKMAFTGKVIEITNLKSVADEVTKGVDSIQGQASSILQSQIKIMVSEGSIKSMIEAVTAYLPGKEVKVGEKWESALAINSGGMSMSTTSSYKLKSLTGNQAEIAAETTLEPSSQAPMEMNGAQITYEVRGLGKSTLTVDVKTGWVIKVSGKSRMQGNMNMKFQGNDMQLPIEVDVKTETVALP